MRLTEQRFERAVTVVLLLGGIWYIATMLSYPDGAGVVPAIIATVLVVAAGVQLVMSVRRGRAAGGRDDQPSSGRAVSTASAAGEEAQTPQDDDHGLEQESYATLLVLRGSRRRRFLVISAFTFLFYVGVLLVGFVVPAGVLMFGLMLVSGERLWTSVVGGIVAAGAAYLFTYVVGLTVLGGVIFQ